MPSTLQPRSSALARATAALRAAQLPAKKETNTMDAVHLARALAKLKASQSKPKSKSKATPHVHMKSGIPGVYYQKKRGRWDVFLVRKNEYGNNARHWCGIATDLEEVPAMHQKKNNELDALS